MTFTLTLVWYDSRRKGWCIYGDYKCFFSLDARRTPHHPYRYNKWLNKNRIYYNEKSWDSPLSLKGMLTDIPPEIEAVFSDYKMNLLEVSYSWRYIFCNDDVRTAFEVTRGTYVGNFNEIRKKYGAKKLSPELVSVIGKMTGSQEIVEMGINSREVDDYEYVYSTGKVKGRRDYRRDRAGES